MTTVEDLANEIDRDFLIHYARPIYDVTPQSHSDSTTSIKLTTTPQLAAGAVLDIDFELMYVQSWNESLKTATVIRGFLGTTAVASDANTLVRINPRYSTAAMLDAVRAEIASWDERVFRVELATVSFDAYYSTAEAITSTTPYRLLRLMPRPDDIWAYDREWIKGTLLFNQDVSQWPSGLAVQVDCAFGRPTTVDALYAMPFPDPAGLDPFVTDLEVDWDVPVGLLEVLRWGVLGRLLTGRESGRLDPQITTSRLQAEAIPANAALQAGAQFYNLRNIAYDREVRRLMAMYGVRF